MKKFVSLVLAAALSASVLGCAGEKAPPPAPVKVETPADKGTDPGTTPAPEGGAVPAPEGEKK